MPLQLGGVHADGDTADMNVSAVALAAVDIAATALDSALLSVERTVERSQQRPEVYVIEQHDAGLQTCLLHAVQTRHGNCDHVHLLVWIRQEMQCLACSTVEHFMQCLSTCVCEDCIRCGLVVSML